MSEASPQFVARRHWLLPSVGLLVWLLFFVGLTVSDWRIVLINADGDPCLHRRIGEWMLEHRTVIRADQFSHTRAGAPLITKEWLSELLYAAAGRAIGWNGVVLVAAALIAATLWLLYRQLRDEGCDLLIATAAVLLAALACSMHWLARPHLFTHLLAVVFAWRLRAFEQGRLSAARLFAELVPWMWLWANLHGAFFIGFILVGIFFAGTVAQRKSARVLLLLGLACFAVTLANPNGWKLHAQILNFLRTPTLSSLANEFRSPNFHAGGTRGFVLLLLLLAVMLLVVRPQLDATEMLMISVWGYFALHSVRNVPIFALTVIPILAGRYSTALKSGGEATGARLLRAVSERINTMDRVAAGGWLWGTVAVVAVAYVLARPVVTTGILPERFPVAAVQYLRSHADAVRGEMFNDYGWGGYLMWELPERKVFVDGRNDFYGAALVEDFKKVDLVRPEWEGALSKYDVGWTILPVAHPLCSVLALRSDWEQLYTDEVTRIYGRRTAR